MKTPKEINAESTGKMVQFIIQQNKELNSFVRALLDLDDTDKFKIDTLRSYVNSQRKELNRFESSLEWEDE